MSHTTARLPAEFALDNAARTALRRLVTAERRRDRADEEMKAAMATLDAIHAAACERFGRHVPRDAFLLDVLECIEVVEGDVWLWRGRRNNRGTAVIRTAVRHGSENSIPRYLAIAFGVISEDDHGSLYPGEHGPDDVNPWHRELRRSEQPLGNRGRYGF